MKFISDENHIKDEPYRFVVMSYRDWFDNAPEFVERWWNKEEALHYGKIRMEEGLIVKVFEEIAFTVNLDPDEEY